MTRKFLLLCVCVAFAGCAHEMDGAPPSVSSVSSAGQSSTGQAAVCLAQAPAQLSIVGANFDPAIRDTLTDSPAVEMPRVLLLAGEQSYEVPAENVSFPADDRSRTRLEVTLPESFVPPRDAGEEAVSYGLRVINPNDKAAGLGDALLVAPPPELQSVDPITGPRDARVEVLLNGRGFWPGMAVRLEATPPVSALSVNVESSTRATATIDLSGVALGTYGITVDNPIGCSDTLENAFTVIEMTFFDVVSIDPPFGCTTEWTTVTIVSNGDFVSTPTVELRSLDNPDAETVFFTRVAFIDASTLTAVLPPGAPLGRYDLIVRNPPSDARAGILSDAFRVVQLPILQINAVLPGRGNTQNNTAVSIFGANFRNPVKVELINASEQITEVAASLAPSSASEIRTTFPTSTMGTGAYLVRVTNLDEATYSTFSNFLNTNPSGNLEVFQMASDLSSARRLLTGGFALDDLGNRYVYAIGGDAGANGEVFDTIESSALSKYGRLGAFREQRYRMSSPRRGASAVMVPFIDAAVSPFVPVKTYVYVTGGKDESGQVLDTVERAMVLRGKDAPIVTVAAADGESSLADGTWYYQVSALMPNNDPDNPGGETLASDEAIITVSGSPAIELSWQPVVIDGSAAVAYRIYRTEDANGASHTQRFLAEVSETSFVDDGSISVSDELPLRPGDTGQFAVLTQRLGVARWGHGAALVSDETGARWLVIAGGNDGSQSIATLERASIGAEAELAAFADTALTPMDEPRAFFAFMVEDNSNVSTYAPLHSRLWAAGGRSTADVTDTLERSELTAAGASAWVVNGKKSGTTAGAMGLIANQKMFLLGGASGFDGETFTGVVSSGRDSEFDDAGDISGSINSTANGLRTARAGGITVQGAGFFYFIGGTSNGSTAVATTEQTF